MSLKFLPRIKNKLKKFWFNFQKIPLEMKPIRIFCLFFFPWAKAVPPSDRIFSPEPKAFRSSDQLPSNQFSIHGASAWPDMTGARPTRRIAAAPITVICINALPVLFVSISGLVRVLFDAWSHRQTVNSLGRPNKSLLTFRDVGVAALH